MKRKTHFSILGASSWSLTTGCPNGAVAIPAFMPEVAVGDAISLGWSEVEIIDEDLGRSAARIVTRTGLERMVAQVCLGERGRSLCT